MIPVSTATNTAGTPIPTVGRVNLADYPMAFTPDGGTLYVLGHLRSGYGTVTPVSTAAGTAGSPVKVGSRDDWTTAIAVAS